MADITKMKSKDVAELFEKGFQPDIYFNMLYPTSPHTFSTNMLAMFHRFFSIDFPNAQSMIDLGCGPTVYSTISASKNIKRIVCSDFLAKNRQEVKKWLNRETGAHDWSNYFEEVAKLEDVSDLSQLEKRVRNSITDVVHCDLTLPNPIAPHTDHFDVVYIGYVYESIATSEEELTRMVVNSASLLNEGGHFICAGVFNADHYYLGDVLFPGYSYTREVMDKALAVAKLEPVLWTIFPRLDKNIPGEYGSFFIVLAKK